MAHDRAKLAHDKHDQERLFAACVLSAPDIAIRDCSWLPYTALTDKALSDFWKDVKDHGDAIKAANDHGLVAELAGWVNKTPNVTTPDVYATGIAEHKYFLDVLSGNSGIAKAALNKDKEQVKRLLGDLQTSDVHKPIKTHSSEILNSEFGDVLDGKSAPYVKTYISTIDNKIGGFYGGDAITFAARPGMGKTALCSVIGRNVAFSGKRVFFFSLEMQRMQLWGRMICGHVGYRWRDVRVGNIDDAGRDKIRKFSEKVQAKMGTNFTVFDDLFSVSEIVQACVTGKPDLVIIDHLGEVHWDNPNDSEVRWYGEAVKLFRTYIAKRLNIPVIIVHQLSRAVEERTHDKRPILKDLKWSGEIEQRSDVVMFLYREDYYLTNIEIESKIVPAELLVRKNRQGDARATIMLEYDLSKQDFKSWVV
jgi:replicative DNA helicase